jgi:hypothetical protein
MEVLGMTNLSVTEPTAFASQLWAAEVASHAQLPDARLNARLAQVLSLFAAKPLDSIPQAAGSWQQAKPVYRFLENERVTPAALLQPIADSTVRAGAAQTVIYAVHDSTSVNYSALQHTVGLGTLNDSPSARGIHLHSALALRSDGTPLGLLDLHWWIRPPGLRTAKKRKRRRLEQKESYKWLRSVRACQAALARNLVEGARPRLLHIMDREGDIHEVLATIADAGDGAVIRGVQNRKVSDPHAHAHQAVRAAPLLGLANVAVPHHPNQPARTALVDLRALRLTITPDTRQHPDRQPTTWTLVEVWEMQPPTGTKPLHWLLWTTETVLTLEHALEIVRIYQLRWRIEEYHLVLKSGCNVEKLELETVERLAKAITLYAAVAVRIVALRDLSRREPQAPCTAVLTDEEWRVLWSYLHKRPCPARTKVPTIREAVLWLGRLGGHLGRKSDGMPGVRTLWRGLRDLPLLVAGYRAGQQSLR